MPETFAPTFARLRSILEKHSGRWIVGADGPGHYCLDGTPGPAAPRAWGGKARRPTIPVAWVRIGKTYVGYHLMGIDGNTKLLALLSKELKGRMQGKTCFNFRTLDDALFRELERVTKQAIADFEKAGFALRAGS
jgi:hypothetical protein